jgi:glycopeptide antibiotics resistance protein
MKILKRQILVAPWYRVKLNKAFIQDIILNIIGFIPFGFFLSAIFLSIGGFVEKHSCLITIFLCLVISLFIEIAQAWMPSRSSQMLDVILNTLGASLGAMLYRFSFRFSPKGTVT